MIGSRASRIAARALRLPQRQEPAVLIRQTAGRREGGRFVPGVPVRLDVRVTAVPQPGGSERETEQGGYRESSRLTFYLLETVSAIVEGSTGADVLIFSGQPYRIIEVTHWGSFYEALGVSEPGAA